MCSSSSPPQTLPLLCSDQQQLLDFHADLQQLYAAIVTHGNGLRRTRKLSEEEQLPAEEADVVSPEGLTNQTLFLLALIKTSSSSSVAALTSSGTGEQSQSAPADAITAPTPAPQVRWKDSYHFDASVSLFHHQLASVHRPQVPSLTDDPAEPSSSKPKKKKVGLFR